MNFKLILRVYMYVYRAHTHTYIYMNIYVYDDSIYKVYNGIVFYNYIAQYE